MALFPIFHVLVLVVMALRCATFFISIGFTGETGAAVMESEHVYDCTEALHALLNSGERCACILTHTGSKELVNPEFEWAPFDIGGLIVFTSYLSLAWYSG